MSAARTFVFRAPAPDARIAFYSAEHCRGSVDADKKSALVSAPSGSRASPLLISGPVILSRRGSMLGSLVRGVRRVSVAATGRNGLDLRASIVFG